MRLRQLLLLLAVLAIAVAAPASAFAARSAAPAAPAAATTTGQVIDKCNVPKGAELPLHCFKPDEEFQLNDWVPIHAGSLNLSINKAVAYIMLASVLTMLLGIFLMRIKIGRTPGKRQALGEAIYEVAQVQVAEQGLPAKAIGTWFPYVATVMLFIWVVNMIGFLPLPLSDQKFHIGGLAIPTFSIYAATAQLSGLATSGPAHWRRLSGGVMADGITSTVAALFGGFPSATYAQNNGVIQITGVASRRVGYVMAGMLALLGLFPAVGRWVTVMPPPVLGGLALMMFGLVAVAGMRLLMADGLGQREGVIVALSLGVGLGLPTQPALLESLPGFMRSLLESSISAGGLTALVLNLAWSARRPAT